MAIWEKLFSKITFKDYPDTSTPLNASNMNALSDAIDGIDDRVVELNSNLENKQNKLSYKYKTIELTLPSKASTSGTITRTDLELADDEVVLFGNFRQGYLTNTLYELVVHTYSIYLGTTEATKLIDYRVYNGHTSEMKVPFTVLILTYS